MFCKNISQRLRFHALNHAFHHTIGGGKPRTLFEFFIDINYIHSKWRLPIMAEEVENHFAKVVIVFANCYQVTNDRTLSRTRLESDHLYFIIQSYSSNHPIIFILAHSKKKQNIPSSKSADVEYHCACPHRLRVRWWDG